MNTDPIADFLTRIRNAIMAKHEQTSIPYSKIKEELSKILGQRKYIQKYEVIDKKIKGYKTVKKDLIITLSPNINEIVLKRSSKPGQRIYTKAKDIKPIRRGYGLSIISTSQGLLTDRDAKKKKVGGEIICEIY